MAQLFEVGWPVGPSRGGRPLGTPKEFGDACTYLYSDKAGFISGQNPLLDGGSYVGLI
jgi:hypothetical protein